MSESIFVLKFAEAKQPEYKEKKGEGYIVFGENNDYPNYLLDLFNKSAKHGALVRNKAKYVIGKGWTTESGEVSQFANKVGLNTLGVKVAVDLEMFGGSYVEVIWSAIGRQIAAVNHIEYSRIRTNKDNTQFWYKDSWTVYSREKKPAEVIPTFNPSTNEKRQILFIKEYRPGGMCYPLPGYISALNFIEADIEVSKHVLGNASTGFTPSKLITLPNGEPTKEGKKEITDQFEKRFTGSDGKKFILSFVTDVARKPIIDDLGASDMTKEDFTAVDTLIQNNIFAAHEVTSPALFGIAQPGKLGGSTELKDAYDIFKNTYVNDKQMLIEGVFNMLSSYAGYNEVLKIIPVNPLGVQSTFADLIAMGAPKEYLFEIAGIDASKYALTKDSAVLSAINTLSPLVANKVLESMTANEVRALATLMPKVGADAITDASGAPITQVVEGEQMVNEHLKNMTAKQHMEMMRIIRQFNKGQLNEQQASTLLRSGLGLTEQDIITMLGLDDGTPLQLSAIDEITIYAAFGEDKDKYEVLASRQKFDDESTLEMFADVSQAESNVLDLIAKDKRITVEVIAETLKLSVKRVSDIIELAASKGYIDSKNITEGKGDQKNIIIERKLTQPLAKIVEDIKPKTTQYMVRYSYEWLPQIPANERNTAAHPSRDFCKQLMSLNRFYSRADIEQISARVGYSVFDRRGGWWNDDGKVSPSCRHRWFSQLVKEK